MNRHLKPKVISNRKVINPDRVVTIVKVDTNLVKAVISDKVVTSLAISSVKVVTSPIISNVISSPRQQVSKIPTPRATA